jgi:uncharacterized protein (DUF305 family)
MQNNKTAVYAILILIAGFLLGLVTTRTSFDNDDNDCRMGHSTAMMDGSNMMGRGDMQEMMDGMMAGLQGKTGSEFDKAFISEMITHHEGAIEMAQKALMNAKRQEIKSMAQDIISAQTKEIDMMKKWEMDWCR